MKTNTLVTHKKLTSLGIGCISKVMKDSCKVNFGLHDVSTCKNSMLIPVDISMCKTIEWSELRSLSLVNSKELPNYVIIGNELKQWVGIGWVTQRVVTFNDLSKYPRAI